MYVDLTVVAGRQHSQRYLRDVRFDTTVDPFSMQSTQLARGANLRALPRLCPSGLVFKLMPSRPTAD